MLHAAANRQWSISKVNIDTKRIAFITRLMATETMSQTLLPIAEKVICSLSENNLRLGSEPPLCVNHRNFMNTVIKVIGIGGIGCDVVNQMIIDDVQGIEFITLDTSVHFFDKSKSDNHIHVDASLVHSVEVDTDLDLGSSVALRNHLRIKHKIMDADMLFIVAGMGGRAGTCISSQVAGIAKQMGIYTVALLTMPIDLNEVRAKVANFGIKALQHKVDSLLVLPNENQVAILKRNRYWTLNIQAINVLVQRVVAGIAGVINLPGLINIEFADVCTILTANAPGMADSATATGLNRSMKATESVLNGALFRDVDLSCASGVLISIASASSLKLSELNEVMQAVQFAAENATVLVGTVLNEHMGKELRVTIVATGFESTTQQV
jgi:cell division protein FtsZ